MKRLVALLIVAAFAVAGLAACTSAPTALVVYSGRSENLISPLIDDFSAQTSIEVEVRYDDSANLALLIEQEGERSPADVFISQSPGAVGFLSGAGLLERIDPEVLSLVPEQFRNADGRWIGMSGRVRTIVYNPELIDEADLPSSVFELTDAGFRSLVGIAPENGSFQDFVTAMRELHGDDATLAWLEAMAANDAQPYAKNSAIVEAVGRGEVPLGLVNHYYNLRAIAEDPSTVTRNYFFPGGDIGSLLITTAIGTLSSSDNQDAALEFVSFMLGADAQTFFAEQTLEYPLITGVAPSPLLPDLSEIEVVTYDFDNLGGGLERTKDLISQSGLEGN